MTVQSYLVYPEPGCRAEVEARLRAIPACDVLPAVNRDLLIVVAQTEDRDTQSALEDQLRALPGVECLALVGGWTDDVDRGAGV